MAKPRPSRLLNISKSPAANKKTTNLNATRSPLLRLPPAVRSRIFDYVFGRKIVHIVGEQSDHSNHYKLTICECPEGHDHLPPRFAQHVLPNSGPPRKDPFCMETHVQNCTRTATRRDFSLGVLGVSRQVYEQTVLRPFRQTVFSQMTYGRYRYYGLPGLLIELVPAQAKAITRMRMVCLGEYFQAQDTIQQLRGLKHLDLLIAPWAFDDDDHDFTQYLETFADQYGIRALARTRLSTVLLAVEVTVDSNATAKTLRLVKEGSASIMRWRSAMETYLLGASVYLDDVFEAMESGELEDHDAAIQASRRRMGQPDFGRLEKWKKSS